MNSEHDGNQDDPVLREIMGEEAPANPDRPQETAAERRARLKAEAKAKSDTEHDRSVKAQHEAKAQHAAPAGSGMAPEHRSVVRNTPYAVLRREMPQLSREQTAERKQDINGRPRANAKAMANAIASFCMDYFEGSDGDSNEPTKPDWRVVSSAIPLAVRLLKRRWSREVLGNPH